ncbi:VWA domain-containing protein [Actinotalea sp. M2MS4P-6]|uniref:VWA domain-containing protein n=1 Tax=Actinotalea sp. M2MS4P-6 TaxID=2983762 RepID=UPI0021E36CD4|nr:VWA domain-containing protein [Actinotalea sp. M2MS4P-6]MCV2393048.1 VWA domain-containing protein [Actinotalea sp. M2MS4P-6]
MTEFSAAVYQNEYLAGGSTDVHAIVTIACAGAGQAGATSEGDAGEIVIVDTSASMGWPGVRAAQAAAAAALDQIIDGTWFALVAGTHTARLVFPFDGTAMAWMDPRTREQARAALGSLAPDGGTAMGTWLELAATLVQAVPSVNQAHAILLTDGKNQHEQPYELDARMARAAGHLQVDCRGVGANWEVGELRRIASTLMGSVDLIPQPEQMAEEFAMLMRQAMARGVASADLRVWAPQGAQVLFVRQVAPSVEDLTPRRRELNPLTGAYPTGSWGDEQRDYHVAVRLPAARAVGQEQLAARVQLAVRDQVVAQGLVKAMWSDDSSLTAQISPEVAHYTGQTELAEAIQDGLAAKASGDDRTATAKLGRAAQLAAETGNAEVTAKLRKVVEIDEAATGKVRLRRDVDKLDEMALDTTSTKTTRVRS